MLEELLPTIEKMIADKAREFAKGNGPKVIFKGVYTMLPSPVRIMVREETFIDFCMKHKNSLLGESKKMPVKSRDKKPITKGPRKASAVKRKPTKKR